MMCARPAHRLVVSTVGDFRPATCTLRAARIQRYPVSLAAPVPNTTVGIDLSPKRDPEHEALGGLRRALHVYEPLRISYEVLTTSDQASVTRA